MPEASDDKPLMNHEELTAFVSVLDVATLAANGNGMTALADMAADLRRNGAL